MVWRISLHRTGYSGVRIPWGATIPATVLALAIPVTAIVLTDPLGAWVWIPAGLLIAGLILGLGIPYQRKYSRG